MLLSAYFTDKTKEIKVQCSIAEPSALEGFLFASHDAGATWQDMSTGLPDEVQPRAIWTSDDGIFLGASNGLYRGTTSPITPMWKKDPFDQAWISGIYTGAKGPYLVSFSKGFFQFHKATGTWKNMHHALKDKSVHTVFETSDGKLFVGCDSGLFVSADGGTSWQTSLNQQIVRSMIEVDGILVIATRHALLRSTDGGKVWERVHTNPGSPLQITHTSQGILAIVEGQEFAGIWTPNEILFSADQGETWQPMTGSFPESFASIYQIASFGQFLFACTREGIFRSADRGKTWEQVRNRPDNNKGNMYKLEVNDQVLFALMIDGC